jgi:hypothetical protein
VIDEETYKMLGRATRHFVLTLEVMDDGGCSGRVIKG